MFPTLCLVSRLYWFHGTRMLFSFPVTRMSPLILVSSYGHGLGWLALIWLLLFALSTGSDRMLEQLQILNQPLLTQIDCTMENQRNHMLQGSPMTFLIQNHSMLRFLALLQNFNFQNFTREKFEKMKSLVKSTDHLKWIIMLSSAWYGCHKSLRPYQKLRHMC